MTESLPLSIKLLVFALVSVSVLLGFLNSRGPSPKITILNRWMRWLSVSFALAFVFYPMEWIQRPFWALVVIFFLLWLLVETLYTWFAISALSQSGISLFPRFKENNTGEEWPASRKLIELRDWLRGEKFAKSQALIADIGGGVRLRSSIYQNSDQNIRIQVIFVPQGNGSISHSVSFSSETADKRTIITDNLFTPYGGFYPEQWDVCRKPWTRSASKLLRLHKKRIQDLELIPYETEPIDDLNFQQRQLERTNIDAGFLVPPHLQEEMGRITWEGRYRVWKEVWLLNYFGISFRG